MTRSTIYLWKSETGKLVRAILSDEVSDDHLEMWSTTWLSAMAAYCAGRNPKNKPEDHHWDWQTKSDHWRPLLAYHSFAIVCDGELQGLMLTHDLKTARLPVQAGKAIVYVDYLATAPWNRREIQRPPRYRGVGTAFIAAAAQLSVDLGYRGRIGLHSLPAAEKFYCDACGMTALGPDMTYYGLTYFEMTERQTVLYRQGRRTR
jgi:hypothetical protein